MSTRVALIGMGMGNPDTLTVGAARKIAESDCLIGAARLLESFPESAAARFTSCSAQAIFEFLCAHPEHRSAVVLLSGDVGFYSGAKGILALLSGLPNFETECIAGISSVQYFCARLCTPWEDVKLLSLHGRSQSLCAAVAQNRKTFALTGGENTCGALCGALTEAGLGNVRVSVGERLSYAEERVVTGTAAELAGCEFAPLSVLLAVNGNAAPPPVTHGLPDEAFLRGGAPMTKAEVRAVSICALQLRGGDVVWDVGAGTGSVSVEIARVLQSGTVYAVEKEPAALELLEQNKRRFGVQNLVVTAGTAPEVLEALPAPDAVFIGGSSGAMAETIAAILAKNPSARIVANAITIETTGAVLASFERHALRDQALVQISVARAKKAGASHMLLGQNPIAILSAGGRQDEP